MSEIIEMLLGQAAYRAIWSTFPQSRVHDAAKAVYAVRSGCRYRPGIMPSLELYDWIATQKVANDYDTPTSRNFWQC